MKFKSRLTAFATIFVLSSVACAPTLAETILLARGDDTFGQGWLFLDASGQCRIATPRHVVERTDGTLSAPDLLDSFGRLHPTESPVAAVDDEVDLAFLTVRGPIAKEGCSRDRVRLTPLQPIIESIKQATLEITTPTERQSLAVAFRALSRDSEGGKIIALSPVDDEVSLQKGMSGGTVLHNGRPIAMLYEVDPDEGVGIALRYDQIASELQKLSAATKSKIGEQRRSFNNLMLLKGRVSKRDTSIGSFLSGTSPLHLSPVSGRVTFVMEMDRLSKVSGLRINGRGLSGQGALIVETDTDGQGFVPGTRCELTDDVVCAMSPRRLSRLRVTITGPAEANYTIDSLEPFGGQQ
ncbi:hypothetical protein [Rhizobium sp. Root483D2]|uniref:hypothetical protein n=1 Tax=Rhizobium sp. Root483D2 TaxID=1736545 RepID=UPI000712FF43|nr:hypothetical protein [Rhizobium sp. Root483D2]KQY25929.1 hypothetical protein ASD32_25960 [Rhizobium sp. Root483D2]